MKGSLFTLLAFAVLFGLLQVLGGPALHQNLFLALVIGIAYIWIPGIVALRWGKREGVDFPAFAWNKSMFWIPLLSFFFVLVAFFFSLLFRKVSMNPVFIDRGVGMAIFIALTIFILNFVVLSFVISFVLLGGELYWRGYLWEKLKGNGPGRAMILTAVLWTLWQLPTTALSQYTSPASFFVNFAITLVFSLALTPLLTFYRVKGRSVFAPAFGLSSLLTSSIVLMILFPSVDPVVGTLEYALCLFIVLLVAYFPMKIFKKETWQLH